jgi:hypothetical protein
LANKKYSDSIHQGDNIDVTVVNDPKSIIESYELGKRSNKNKKNSKTNSPNQSSISKNPKAKNDGTFIWSIITTLALAALLVLLAQQYGGDLFSQSADESSQNDQIILASTADDPDPIAQNCLDHSGLARHDHSNLNIYINGVENAVPSTIGINTEVCNQEGGNMHAVHTHDATGKLHIESNEDIDIPIGVFFDIWGVHFNETGIFDYRVNSTHELIMTIDGVANYDFDDYLLVDGKEIAVVYQERAV